MQVWIEPDIGCILRQVVDGIFCNFGLILLLFESTLRVSFVTEVLETEPSTSFTPAECSTPNYIISKILFGSKMFSSCSGWVWPCSHHTSASCLAGIEKHVALMFVCCTAGLSQVWALLFASSSQDTTGAVSCLQRAGALLEWWTLLGSVCFAFSNNSV